MKRNFILGQIGSGLLLVIGLLVFAWGALASK